MCVSSKGKAKWRHRQEVAEPELVLAGQPGLPTVEIDYYSPGLPGVNVLRSFLRWLLEAGVTGSFRIRSDGRNPTQAVAQYVASQRGASCPDARVIVEQ